MWGTSLCKSLLLLKGYIRLYQDAFNPSPDSAVSQWIHSRGLSGGLVATKVINRRRQLFNVY